MEAQEHREQTDDTHLAGLHEASQPKQGRSPEWYLHRWRKRHGLVHEPGGGKLARFRSIDRHCPVTVEQVIDGDLPKHIVNEFYWYQRRVGPKICAYCNTVLRDAEVTIDHVIPRASGGSHLGRDNLVTACAPCNRRKGHQKLLVFLQRDAEQRRANLD